MKSEKSALLLSFEAAAIEACKELQTSKFPFLTQELIWHILVYELDHADQPTDIIWHRLTKEDIILLVRAYYLKYGVPIGALSVGIPVDQSSNTLEKATIKIDGHIYRIHKNDLDPFPSQPHAHDLTEHVKIHLGTGEKYRNSGTVGNKLHKKDLQELRQQITLQMPELVLPPLE